VLVEELDRLSDLLRRRASLGRSMTVVGEEHERGDHAALGEYHQATRERSGFLSWLDEWVTGLPDHATHMARVRERFEALRPAAKRLAAEVDYA
jgi:type II secretory pathway component PulF